MRVGIVAVALAALACGEPTDASDAGVGDAGRDARADAGFDAGARDAGSDGGFDAGDRDAGWDAGVDGGVATWAELPPGPEPRWGHVAVYDARRDRMLIATGTGRTGRLDDLWALDLTTGAWTRLEPEGARPSARFTATAVIDPARDRMILFHGDDGTGGTEDVWALDLETHVFSPLPTGPVRRFDAAAASDGRRAWVFAGFAPGYIALRDLHEYDLETDTWRELPDGPGGFPSRRTNLVMAYDREGDRLVIWGGHGNVDVPTPDAWAYLLGEERWVELAPGGPTPPVVMHQAYADDPGCGVVWIFGGDNADEDDVDEVWALRTRPPESFVRVDVAADPLPAPRRHGVLVRDRRGHLVTFGGWRGLSENLGDTWRLPVTCPP